MSTDAETTISKIINHIDGILLQYGREKGLRIIEGKIMKLSMACAEAGDSKNSDQFLEILSELKKTLGAQAN